MPALSATNIYGQTFFEQTGIVASLPPIAKLDDVILNADVFEISSTIQEIVAFVENCNTKLPYLQQVVQRIKEHIEYNRGLLAEEERRMTSA